MSIDQVPKKVQDQVAAARHDINLIHWDDSWPEGGEWWVPVESYFSEHDAPGDAGWKHGHLRIELDDAGKLVDQYVGDWDAGMHPDLHTFER